MQTLGVLSTSWQVPVLLTAVPSMIPKPTATAHALAPSFLLDYMEFGPRCLLPRPFSRHHVTVNSGSFCPLPAWSLFSMLLFM